MVKAGSANVSWEDPEGQTWTLDIRRDFVYCPALTLQEILVNCQRAVAQIC